MGKGAKSYAGQKAWWSICKSFSTLWIMLTKLCSFMWFAIGVSKPAQDSRILPMSAHMCCGSGWIRMFLGLPDPDSS